MRRFRPNQAFRFSDDLFTDKTAMTAFPPAPIKRRLAALMYELLLTGAVTAIAAILAGIAAIFLNPVSHILSSLVTCVIFVGSWWLYFKTNWTKTGRTGAALIWLILPWGFALLNPDRQFLYDFLAGTRLVDLKQETSES